MRKIEKASREDWEKLGTDVKLMYDVSVRAFCRASKMFGKSHPLAKDFMRIDKIMAQLKSDLDEEAYRHARHLFKYEELNCLFYGKPIGRQGDYVKKCEEYLL